MALEVAAGATGIATLTLRPGRRGWFAPGAARVSTRYPLGLVEASAAGPDPAPRLVYPRPAPLGTPGSAGAETGAADEGGDFQGLRDYQPGDPPRRIHWTGVAKGQGVAVKRFGRDTGSDPAASGRRYGLRLPDRTLPPDAGPAHRRRCLEALALCPY